MIKNIQVNVAYPALVAGCFLAAYHSTIAWMYHRFTGADSYYSHGFLIPFVSAYLIWSERAALRDMKLDFSWWGLVLILVAIFTHAVGVILYVFSISGISLFLLFIGTALFLLGKPLTKRLLFPLAFLIFMIPIPQAFIEFISFPMKMLVASAGTSIASGIGIPVFREGFFIYIPAGSLLVENPCSGLRSLISFLAIGSVFAYLSPLPTSRKIMLFLLAAPIAIFSNILRVPILIAISHYYGLSAAAPDSLWHSASGVFVFVIGIIAFFMAGKCLQCKSSK